MSDYHRLFFKGGTYFFTVVTHHRQPILCDEYPLNRLKAAFRYTMKKHPFRIYGLIILPDHLHCIWQLPENDDNFSIRWNMIKRYFSIGLESPSNYRREKNIWQKRFWEHLIRNEEELHRCLDYIHYNPVKHGYTKTPFDWSHSTFKHHVSLGHYDKRWGCAEEPQTLKKLLLE